MLANILECKEMVHPTQPLQFIRKEECVGVRILFESQRKQNAVVDFITVNDMACSKVNFVTTF